MEVEVFVLIFFRDTFYAAKMQEQMDELDQLKAERQRLLSIQQELQSLNSRFPSVSSVYHTLLSSESRMTKIIVCTTGVKKL